jgi:fucose permease
VIPEEKRTSLSVFPLYAAFAATGLGVALPGALLPALLPRWHMSDAQGGRLFLLAFLGSSLGALLVRGSLRTMMLLGGLAIAGGAAALGFSGGTGADAWMFLYGAGLGATMTAISLIRQQQAVRTGVEMVRLNLLWALGAFVCPSLTVRALSAGIIRPLWLGVSASFLLLALWAAVQPEVRLLPARAEPARGGVWRVFAAVPAALIVMIVLITGIEASAGGWLATYARRGGHSVADTIAAPTVFWAGLLLSRLFWSARTRVSQAWVVRCSLGLMGAASILLVAGGSTPIMLIAAFCLGFGIGPTYPLLLAWALHFERGGTIFFLAGVGSACLPWLTGVVSSRFGSLRMGLLVPMSATLLMLGLAVARPIRHWTGE